MWTHTSELAPGFESIDFGHEVTSTFKQLIADNLKINCNPSFPVFSFIQVVFSIIFNRFKIRKETYFNSALHSQDLTAQCSLIVIFQPNLISELVWRFSHGSSTCRLSPDGYNAAEWLGTIATFYFFFLRTP